MTHLACGDDTYHPANADQYGRFTDTTAALPGIPKSIAASAAIFLGRAKARGTIGYEMLTSLGRRYDRRYLPPETAEV